MPKRRRTEDEGYYDSRLAEPELLERALLLDVKANEEPLAVPVGKLRRGGHIEFLDGAEAEKAVSLLSGRDGFPNPRMLKHGRSYFEVRWGDEPPFDGCDYVEPICALLLGVHYGYSEPAIAEQVRKYMGYPKRHFTKTQIASLIRSARNR